MSSKTVVICDRCGQEMTFGSEDPAVHREVFTYKLSMCGMQQILADGTHDLCTSCCEEAESLLYNFMNPT